MSGIIAQNTLDNSGLIKSPAGGGAWNFISKSTASSDSTIDFTSGIDSTYKEYLFTFKNIHPASDSAEFSFQADTGTNTSYNQTITSTFFNAQHRQDAAVSGLAYAADHDLAQSTSFCKIGFRTGNDDADMCISGELHIFGPSSDTFVKHFYSRFSSLDTGPYACDTYAAGYFNLTTALTRFQFKMNTGNIDSGTIKLYGVT